MNMSINFPVSQKTMGTQFSAVCWSEQQHNVEGPDMTAINPKLVFILNEVGCPYMSHSLDCENPP